MAVEELGEILELLKSGAGDAESKYQFVDVREEEELVKAKLDGEREGAHKPRQAQSGVGLGLRQKCFRNGERDFRRAFATWNVLAAKSACDDFTPCTCGFSIVYFGAFPKDYAGRQWN